MIHDFQILLELVTHFWLLLLNHFMHKMTLRACQRISYSKLNIIYCFNFQVVMLLTWSSIGLASSARIWPKNIIDDSLASSFWIVINFNRLRYILNFIYWNECCANPRVNAKHVIISHSCDWQFLKYSITFLEKGIWILYILF